MLSAKMMTAELQHPRVFFGGRSQNGDKKEILAEHRVVSSLIFSASSPVNDLLNLLEAPAAQR